MIAVTAVPSKAPSVLGISKSLKKSESASATRSMLPFCVETMATGPVQGVMPPPVDRCMVTPKINEAGVLVPLKYVSVPNGKTWPETTSLREWPVKVRALGGVPPLSSPQVTLDVPMPETTAVLVLSLETGRRVPVWRKSPDSTGLSKKPVMVPESLGAGAPGVEAMTIEEASVQAMPTIMIRRGCFIRSPFIVRMTEMFSSAARRGQWHSAARRNEVQSAEGPSGHRPQARKSRGHAATRRRGRHGARCPFGLASPRLLALRVALARPPAGPGSQCIHTSETTGGQGATAHARVSPRRRMTARHPDRPGSLS